MASPARASILQGPATILYDGVTFHSKGDVELGVTTETFEVDSSTSGKLDERLLDTSVEVTFTPSGEFINLTKLWPYNGVTPVPGASIFGARTLIIYPATGNAVTVLDAAVIQQPDIILATDKTMLGPVKFFGIRADTVDMGTTASVFSIAAVGSPSLTAEDATKIFTEGATGGYTLHSGAVTNMDTEDGWTVSFPCEFSDVKTDGYGLIDKRFVKCGAMAKAKVYNMVEADMAGLVRMATGQLIQRGQSLNGPGVNLILTGRITVANIVTLNKCFVKSGGLIYSTTNKRMAEVEFVATRTGLSTPLFTLANS